MLEPLLGYPNIRTQLDQLWHDIDSGKFGAVNGKTGDWFVGISSVKTAIAKT